MSYDITLANAVDWALAYDGPLFHALLCDPPYHLTSIVERFGKAGAAAAQFGSDGAFARASKGFMGRDWDGGDVAFRPETWAAFGRVLHPGAFGMAFASTRGFHRMAVAIEDAGFIIHPVIMCWAFGSGFPKATRLDVQIDRAAGATPLVVGSKKHQPKFAAADFGYREKDNGFNSKDRESFDLTSGATPLAQAWGGHRYGLQSLKPALEPIIVFQKPYQGRPIDCITRTGAGAINIDQARITPSSPSHDDRAYTLRSSRGSDACTPDHSLEQIRNCLLYVSSVLRSGSTDDTYPSHGEADQDGTQLDPAVCEHLLDRLYPNGAWCGLDLSTVRGYQDDCLFCHGSYGELFHRAQVAAQVSAPSLAGVLEHICTVLSEPSRSPMNECIDHHSSGDALGLSWSFLRLLIGDTDAVCNAIIAYSTPPRKGPQSDPAQRAGVVGRDFGFSRTTPDAMQAAQRESTERMESLGRWPSNLILSHHPECNGHCVELCPVRRLGEQSGESTAGTQQGGGSGGIWSTTSNTPVSPSHGDSGTAARYFYNADWMLDRLEDSDPLIYQAKASTAEREAGLEDFESITVDDGREKPIDNAYLRGETSRKNPHPTIKPIATARHLATLLLPPAEYGPRRLFVPFAGVASEMIGGMLAGWEDVQGIELTADHIPVAEARLAYWQQLRYKLMNPDAPIKAQTSRTPSGQIDMFAESEAA